MAVALVYTVTRKAGGKHVHIRASSARDGLLTTVGSLILTEDEYQAWLCEGPQVENEVVVP